MRSSPAPSNDGWLKGARACGCIWHPLSCACKSFRTKVALQDDLAVTSACKQEVLDWSCGPLGFSRFAWISAAYLFFCGGGKPMEKNAMEYLEWVARIPARCGSISHGSIVRNLSSLPDVNLKERITAHICDGVAGAARCCHGLLQAIIWSKDRTLHTC